MVIHPFLVRHETEIDETLQNFGEKGMQAVRTFTQQGVNLAANTVVTSAIKVGHNTHTRTHTHTHTHCRVRR